MTPWVHPFATIRVSLAPIRELFLLPRSACFPQHAAFLQRLAQQVLHLAVDRAQLRLREALDLGPELRVDPEQVRLALGHRGLRYRACRCSRSAACRARSRAPPSS